MKKRKIYSREVEKRIEEQIPKEILEALSSQGWNALGIYELVKKEIELERKQKS